MFSRLILIMPTTYGNDIVYCLKSHCGVRDIVGRSGCFKFKLSANSVMRGRVNAIRTFKGLVADLRLYIVVTEYSFYKHDGVYAARS